MWAWLVGIIFGVIAVAATTIYLKIKSMRKADVVSAVINFLAKHGIFQKLNALGLQTRPPQVTDVKASNGFIVPLNPVAFCTVEEVLSLKLRESDIFVATYPKAGTTWMLEITWLICNNVDVQSAKRTDVNTRCPFLEIVDISDNDSYGLQSVETWPEDKRRIIKTHMPFELLPQEVQSGANCKIIYVARNPKDLCVSYYHYHRGFKQLPEPGTWGEFLARFCKGKQGWGCWFQHNLKYWAEYQNDKRIYFVTYESLKSDLRGEVKGISDFLGKDLTNEQLDVITEHCSFRSMSENEMTNFSHLQKTGFDFKISKFMRKGEIGDWKNHFTINQNIAFDELYKKKMDGSELNFEFE